MRTWLAKVERFLRSEDGPTAVEYAFMLSLILAVCYAAVSTVGSSTNNNLGNQKLSSAVGGS